MASSRYNPRDTQNSARSVRDLRQCCKNPMLTYRLYGLQQIASGIRLHDIPSCSRVQSLAHHLRRIMLRNEQNLETGSYLSLLNQPARLQAIHSRHGDVEHNDIGLQSLDLIQGLESVRSFTHNFPTRPSLQQSPQALSHDGMIVHQQDSDCHKVSSSLEAAS